MIARTGLAMKSLVFWERAKDWLAATFHVTHWTIHVVVGLALLVVFGRLLRVPLRSPWPLLPIALLEAINEAVDFARFHVSHWRWTPTPTLIEIALTLVPPATVVVMARLATRQGSTAG